MGLGPDCSQRSSSLAPQRGNGHRAHRVQRERKREGPHTQRTYRERNTSVRLPRRRMKGRGEISLSYNLHDALSSSTGTHVHLLCVWRSCRQRRLLGKTIFFPADRRLLLLPSDLSLPSFIHAFTHFHLITPHTHTSFLSLLSSSCVSVRCLPADSSQKGSLSLSFSVSPLSPPYPLLRAEPWYAYKRGLAPRRAVKREGRRRSGRESETTATTGRRKESPPFLDLQLEPTAKERETDFHESHI